MIRKIKHIINDKRVASLEHEIATLKIDLEKEKNLVVEKNAQIHDLIEEVKKLNDEIDRLKGIIRSFVDDKFGSSSEKQKYLENLVKEKKVTSDISQQTSTEEVATKDELQNYEKKVIDINKGLDELKEKRKRGGQKGHKGKGRKIPKEIEAKEIHFSLSEEDCRCPICGKVYRKIERFQRESYEIEVIIKVTLKKYTQDVYERECNCNPNAPELIVAPKPQSIIYKSIYSTETWCKFLGLKYLTGIPVNRFNQLLQVSNYKFNSSTIIEGFKKLLEIMTPLYRDILKYNKQEGHWHADETRWCRMMDAESNKNKLHWMWVFVASKSVAYVFDATRSGNVPKDYFKNTSEGILNVDRLASYNTVKDKILLAYCWFHLRRDFITVGKKYKSLMEWALRWIKKIRKIEQINRKRVDKYSQNKPYNEYQEKLETLVNAFFEDAQKELNNGNINEAQVKVLKNMIKKIEGYKVFVEHPFVPMHNNVAENQFRHIAYARNNYYGSCSSWGGNLAAVTWTIFKTAELNGLNPIQYIEKYFKEYVRNNGFPDEIPKELLPWNCIDQNSDDTTSNAG